ncbi:hypothetical protein BAU15_05025 [Enterococcus sp. JM4C]|uniref:hypothetical protein n=1 Tax=Candidatus Enterococcus huntleyi TaxID=1857217 RepID=UPI00137A5A92|nr:hypothetical protein [Enterococcus sp. JM4C]KAF1295119.1 hypothetical protein BAU15_05025 [Enterococcus sp. JM4C]
MSQSRLTVRELFQEDFDKLEKQIQHQYLKDGLADVALQQHRCLQIRSRFTGILRMELYGEELIRGIYLHGYRADEQYWPVRLYPYFRKYFSNREDKQITENFRYSFNYQLKVTGELAVDMESLIVSEEIRDESIVLLMKL